MEYVYLSGSEEVAKAGVAISHAAETMKQTASEFDASLMQMRCFMDDWLARLDLIINRKEST